MSKKVKKQWKDMSTNERIAHIVTYLIAIGIVVGLPLWFIISVANAPAPTPSSFVAEIGNSSFIDPSTRKVEYTVTNNSDVAQKASCYVSVQNSGGTYTGSTVANTSLLNPHETKTFSSNIAISKEGALYITEGTVTCQK